MNLNSNQNVRECQDAKEGKIFLQIKTSMFYEVAIGNFKHSWIETCLETVGMAASEWRQKGIYSKMTLSPLHYVFN